VECYLAFPGQGVKPESGRVFIPGATARLVGERALQRA